MENDVTAAIRDAGHTLPLARLTGAPREPVGGITEESISYVPEKWLTDFFVLDAKPIYFFCMISSLGHILQFKREIPQETRLFVTINDNFDYTPSDGVK